MYIKLTKLDNNPIWLNAAFIVTIEPRKLGGSTVVPIGDGLDYDVKESAETVLSLLEGAIIPTVVPVPTTTDKPAAKPADEVAPAPEPAAEPVKAKVTRKTATRKKTKAAKTKAEAEKVEAEAEAGKAEAEKVEVPTLPAEMLERLRKLAPGSRPKLMNTLVSQFKSVEPEAAIQALVESGAITINEKGRVVWAHTDAQI